MSGIFLTLPCRVIIGEVLSQIKICPIITSLKQMNGYFYRYAVSIEKSDKCQHCQVRRWIYE